VIEDLWGFPPEDDDSRDDLDAAATSSRLPRLV
jgi:hypothetical protein